MGAHEVTVGQFKHFVKATGYKTEAERNGKGAIRRPPKDKGKWKWDKEANWRNPGFEQNDDHPVVCASWEDAAAFCHWLSRLESKNYALPTEAQWEYCCRAGTLTKFSSGDGLDLTPHAWFLANAATQTHPVGQKQPNAWGLFDLQGNAAEWTADWYASDYHKKGGAEDPHGPPAGVSVVMRGGGWSSDVSSLRAALRNSGPPFAIRADLGFRVICAIPEPTEGPGPFDRLRAEDIPADKRAMAEQGDGKLPTGLVAVLGDGRFAHWAKIRTALFGADCKVVASWGGDETAQIWAYPSGKLLRRWHASGLAGSSDGRRLAILLPKKDQILLWDLASDRQLGLVTAQKDVGGFNRTLYLDRTGDILAVDSAGGVLVFDVKEPKKPPRRFPDRLVALSADGKMLATGTDKKLTVRRISGAAKEMVLEVDGATTAVFAPDGKLLATTDGRQNAALWELSSGRRRHVLHTDGFHTYSLVFTPDSKWLASAGHGNKGTFWDVASGKPVPGLGFGGGLAFAFSSDARTLIVADHWDTSLMFYDTQSKRRTGNANLVGADVSGDGRLMTLCSRDSRLFTWRVGAESPGEFLGRHEQWGGSERLFLSADARSLVLEAQRLRGWDMVHRKLYTGPPWDQDARRTLSRDGMLLALFRGPTTEIWGLLGRRVVRILSDAQNHFFGGEFSPDNKVLATWGKDHNAIQLWNVRTGKKFATLKDKDIRPLVSLRFTPDGKLLLSRHEHSINIHVLDLNVNTEVQVHRECREGAVSPDGKTLAQAGLGGVGFCDLLTGKAVAADLRFGPVNGVVRGLFWAPDGRHLVTVNRNGTVYVFRLGQGLAGATS
jgi:WD40 repeat protein